MITKTRVAYGHSYLACVEDVSLVESVYLVFARMPRESDRRRLGSLLYLCYVFRAPVNSLVGHGHVCASLQQNLLSPNPTVQTPHTPSIAFRHLPPNSARVGYATERALFIYAQPSTDAVSALRKVWVLRLWKHARKHEAHPPQVKKEEEEEEKKEEFRLDSNGFGFI